MSVCRSQMFVNMRCRIPGADNCARMAVVNSSIVKYKAARHADTVAQLENIRERIDKRVSVTEVSENVSAISPS